VTSVSRKTRALLALALEETEEMSLSPGSHFGDYEIVRELGRGGQGCVYLARHVGVHPLVALKIIRQGVESSRFRRGASAAAELLHPNIVGVYHVGTHEGRAFYTMQYVGDESLESILPALGDSPESTASLLAKVARAVDYAHEHKVLHRDLKPSNILVQRSADGYEPFVADFDLVKLLEPSGCAQASAVVGTADYMSPEQLPGSSGQLTRATDIYSLGVILYQILARQVPFPAGNLADKLRQIQHEPPPLPGTIRRVHPDLEAICLKCLSKAPRKRYRTCAELANELERVAGKQSVDAERPSLPARAESWLRWHRGITFAIAAALAMVLASTLLYLIRRERNNDVLDSIGTFATGQAGAVLFQLSDSGRRVRELSEDPAVVALLDASEPIIPSALLAERAGNFATLFVAKTDGKICAEWPAPPQDVRGRDYIFRDYFKGALALARAGSRESYLARAFLSEADRQMEFGFSAPVYDRGRLAGVLVASFNVGSAFRAAGMAETTSHGNRRTVVLGPRDLDRGGRVMPSDFTFLIHPLLSNFRVAALTSATSRVLAETFGPAAPAGRQFVMAYAKPVLLRDYADPVDTARTPWLAAFAPIGRTGYVLAIQSQAKTLSFEWVLVAVALAAVLGALNRWRVDSPHA
jgi:serine/threonine protein kinase